MRTVLLLLIKFKRSKWKKKKFCSFFLFISLFSHLFRLGIVHWSVIRFTNSILCHFHLIIKTIQQGTSPVAQWLRIHLPMQGTWVQSLVWEDPTWHGATKPMCHNYWVCALEPVSHSYWAHVPQLLKPVCLGLCSTTREATAMRSLCTTTKSSPCSPQQEKARTQQWRPNTAQINKLKKKKSEKKCYLFYMYVYCFYICCFYIKNKCSFILINIEQETNVYNWTHLLIQIFKKYLFYLFI